MRKYIALFLALGLIATLAVGCTGGEGSTEGPETVIRMALGSEPPTLDPAQSSDTTSHAVIKQVFEGLMQNDVEGNVTKCLAEDYTVDESGTVYTFTLRKGVKFHNGDELTADDVIYSFNRALRDGDSYLAETYLGDIVGAMDVINGDAEEATGLKKIDDYTVEITVKEKIGYFLAKLTYSTAYIVNKAVVEEGGEDWYRENLVGTGPYTLSEWKPNEKVVLVKNENYWQEGKPYIDKVEMPIVEDSATAFMMYLNDELDVTGVPPAEYERVDNDPELTAQKMVVPEASTFYIGLNQNAFPPFKDVRVRQAFNHAIDREQFCEVIWQGRKTPAKGILPPGFPGYSDDLEWLEFDPEKAQQLLADAGYEDPTTFPTLVLETSSGSALVQQIVEYYQNQLETNLGIDVELQFLDWGTLLERVHSENHDLVDAWSFGWIADYMDGQNFLSLLLHSESPYNEIGYSNPAVDSLLNKADHELNQELRNELYKAAHQMLVLDAPWVPVYHNKATILVKPWVKGYERGPMGAVPLRDVKIEK